MHLHHAFKPLYKYFQWNRSCDNAATTLENEAMIALPSQTSLTMLEMEWWQRNLPKTCLHFDFLVPDIIVVRWAHCTRSITIQNSSWYEKILHEKPTTWEKMSGKIDVPGTRTVVPTYIGSISDTFQPDVYNIKYPNTVLTFYGAQEITIFVFFFWTWIQSLKEYESRKICSNHFTNLIEQEGVIAVKFEKFVTDNTK